MPSAPPPLLPVDGGVPVTVMVELVDDASPAESVTVSVTVTVPPAVVCSIAFGPVVVLRLAMLLPVVMTHK